MGGGRCGVSAWRRKNREFPPLCQRRPHVTTRDTMQRVTAASCRFAPLLLWARDPVRSFLWWKSADFRGFISASLFPDRGNVKTNAVHTKCNCNQASGGKRRRKKKGSREPRDRGRNSHRAKQPPIAEQTAVMERWFWFSGMCQHIEEPIQGLDE